MPRLGPTGGAATPEQRQTQRLDSNKRKLEELRESQRRWVHKHRHQPAAALPGPGLVQGGPMLHDTSVAAAGPSAAGQQQVDDHPFTTPATVKRPSAADNILSQWTTTLGPSSSSLLVDVVETCYHYDVPGPPLSGPPLSHGNGR